jgi:7,8-dihydropterin-6-yl-methyl-4-(beta-D-ribofuranosyl)aminobenzene 5'-phosphate synthase
MPDIVGSVTTKPASTPATEAITGQPIPGGPSIIIRSLFSCLAKFLAFCLTKVTSFPELPSLTADGMICVTGEIPRKKSFETGYTQHKVLVKGAWTSDPLIRDECAIAIIIKGKDTVVISGCAHAGIINTMTYAQQITRTEKVYAVIGGFHLAGENFEKRIPPTIEELQRINPKLIVPSHCTGWKAMCAMANMFPEKFVWNSVGNLYKIG